MKKVMKKELTYQYDSGIVIQSQTKCVKRMKKYKNSNKNKSFEKTKIYS